MANTNIFLPGSDELLLISGENSIAAAVKKCFGNPNLEILVLKNGSKGCTVFSKNETISMGVYPIKAIDATGAGDSFDGAFIFGLLENKNLKYAAQMVSAAGALNTAAFGPMEGNISNESLTRMIQDNEK